MKLALAGVALGAIVLLSGCSASLPTPLPTADVGAMVSAVTTTAMNACVQHVGALADLKGKKLSSNQTINGCLVIWRAEGTKKFNKQFDY